jgi:hypothetical protein
LALSYGFRADLRGKMFRISWERSRNMVYAGTARERPSMGGVSHTINHKPYCLPRNETDVVLLRIESMSVILLNYVYRCAYSDPSRGFILTFGRRLRMSVFGRSSGIRRSCVSVSWLPPDTGTRCSFGRLFDSDKNRVRIYFKGAEADVIGGNREEK